MQIVTKWTCIHYDPYSIFFLIVWIYQLMYLPVDVFYLLLLLFSPPLDLPGGRACRFSFAGGLGPLVAV